MRASGEGRPDSHSRQVEDLSREGKALRQRLTDLAMAPGLSGPGSILQRDASGRAWFSFAMA